MHFEGPVFECRELQRDFPAVAQQDPMREFASGGHVHFVVEPTHCNTRKHG
jgi:hypothetical protein